MSAYSGESVVIDRLFALDEQWLAEHPEADGLDRPLIDTELRALGLTDDGLWWAYIAEVRPGLFIHTLYRHTPDRSTP